MYLSERHVSRCHLKEYATYLHNAFRRCVSFRVQDDTVYPSKSTYFALLHKKMISSPSQEGTCFTFLQETAMSPSSSSKGQSCRQVSNRATQIKPFIVMEVMRSAALLESKIHETETSDASKVLHLEIGQPSTPPPKSVLNHIASLPHPLGYTQALGFQSLRVAISRHYDEWYQVHVPPSCIAITTGASGAILAAVTSCFDKGDRVAVAVPGYPCYRNMLAALCVEIVPILVDATTNFQPTIEQLRQALPIDGVIVASPTNPSGSVIKDADLTELVAFCKQQSTRLIVDEIYHGIGPLPATAVADEDVMVINSFSKYWCMTGFRVGWLATRDIALIEAVERCLQNLSICAPAISQHAAEKALTHECRAELQAHVERYSRNQHILVEQIRTCGFETSMPDGAFYVWAQCDNVCRKVGLKDSIELCQALLREARVAVTPGIDFDPDRGHRFVRFSCSGSEEEVTEAAKRICDFCSR